MLLITKYLNMKILALFTVLVFLAFYANAQISKGGLAPSLYYNLAYDNAKIVKLSSIDMNKIEIEDAENLKDGTPLKYAESIFVNLTIDNSGYWQQLPDGREIWRLKIQSDGALALGVYYDKFIIPEGGELYLYDETKQQQLGAYTIDNNKPHGRFANELIKGETITIEYVESPSSPYKPIISISEIAYAFRNVNFLLGNKEFGDSESCQNNINCTPIGDDWQDEKRGVARISIKIGDGYYSCTGSLINNVKEDCYPYFLTADHCAEGATDEDLESWVFYFNYEAVDCTNPATEPSSNTMTGAFHVANGGNGGDSGSDFYLLALETYPTEAWNVYYNGWNRSTTASAGGAGIHHPSGDIKKISTYTQTPISSSWGSASGSHWTFRWADGVTEGGSSGSPMFNSSGLIVGDLTGGSSTCTNLLGYDYYGKFSYSWASNGTTADKRLKDWLDPDNSGVMSLNGMNQTCGTILPVVAFSESDTLINKGQTVSFTDETTGLPNWWKWTFQGGTPSLSFDKNRTVTYNTPGIYDVTLWAKNGFGGDTLVKSDRIIVLDTAPLNADFTVNMDTIFVGDSVNFTSLSTGTPFFYDWTFDGAVTNTSTIKNPLNIKYNIPGFYAVRLIVNNTVSFDTAYVESYIYVQDTVELNADFTSNFTTIFVGDSLDYTNLSTGTIISNNWTFEGATPSISSDDNPSSVKYNTIGIFSTKLIVFNNLNYDTALVQTYVTVKDTSNSVEELNLHNINIYPNPTKNNLFVDLSKSDLKVENIRFYNELGQLLFEEIVRENKLIELKLDQYSQGIYFINLITNDKILTERISIRR